MREGELEGAEPASNQNPLHQKNTRQMAGIFLAPQRGFEPPTYRLGGGRSILLSYWGMKIASAQIGQVLF